MVCLLDKVRYENNIASVTNQKNPNRLTSIEVSQGEPLLAFFLAPPLSCSPSPPPPPPQFISQEIITFLSFVVSPPPLRLLRPAEKRFVLQCSLIFFTLATTAAPFRHFHFNSPAWSYFDDIVGQEGWGGGGAGVGRCSAAEFPLKR